MHQNQFRQPRQLWRTLCCAVALGLFAFAPLVDAQAKDSQAKKETKDTVTLKGGKSEAGKVQSEEYAGLQLEVKPGQTKTIAWSDIVGVEYSNSDALPKANDAIEQGRLDEALSTLQGMKSGATKLRPVISQQVLYRIPMVLQRLGKLDDAAAGYKELFEAFPKGRYLRNAGEGWVECMLAKGDTNGAEDALSKIKLAAQGVTGADADVAMIQGRVLEAKKSFPTARAAYESAEKSSPAGSSTAQEAQLGRARCYIGEGNKAEADKILQDLKQTGQSNVVLAGAWNSLGELLTDEAKPKRDTNMLLDALYMHLRGVVLLQPAPVVPTYEFERALAGAARVCQYISELEANAERKKLYKDRAEVNRARLKKEFPNSPYLKNP